MSLDKNAPPPPIDDGPPRFWVVMLRVFALAGFLWLVVVSMFGCGGDGAKHDPPPAAPHWTFNLILPKSQEPAREQWTSNLLRIEPILDRAGIRPRSWTIQVWEHTQAKCAGRSKRISGHFSFMFYPLRADDPGAAACGIYGPMAREHFTNGLSWEIAHDGGCQLHEDTCNDENYRTTKWAAVDQEIRALAWLGSMPPEF